MIYEETFDYLWNQLAGANDARVTTREKDYQRKRLKRALLARCMKPYFLEAEWTNITGLAGETLIALTDPVTRPLLVLDGALRTTGTAEATPDGHNFEIRIERTGGDSRVQPSTGFIRDVMLLTPAQAALRPIITLTPSGGHGALYPLRWPVPLKLAANELLQVESRVLPGNVTADVTTFAQFRAVAVDNEAEDDYLVRELRETINAVELQKPVFLEMCSENARTIVFPAAGANQHTVAKTREAENHLLVLGYAALFGRGIAGQMGSSCSPKWRLQSSDGHSFSKDEVDINTYAYAGPGFFWNELPYPFMLTKGNSLSASFSTRDAIASETERIDNMIIFRCVNV